MAGRPTGGHGAAALRALHAAVRRAASSRAWSQGVELARAGAVSHESEDDYEVVLRVAAPGRAVAPSVVLYPGDGEWDCDCPNSEATCAHVAAAIIALSQAREGDRPLADAAAAGRVRYALTRDDGSLAIERYVVTPGAEHRVETTLSALVSGRVPGPPVSPEQADLIVDQLLGTRTRGRIALDRLPNVLRALADASPPADVTLDGRAVTVSRDPVLPRAAVEDHPRGALLAIRRAPEITDVVAPGLALCGDALRPLGAVDLTGTRLERLPSERVYERGELDVLMTRVVPALRERIGVEVGERGGPALADVGGPRIAFDVEQGPARLAVMARMVYGEGPNARIDGDAMVHLAGAIPVRDRAVEARLRARLRDELNLVTGQRAVFEGHDAAAFASRLAAWQGKAPRGAGAADVVAATPLVPRMAGAGDDVQVVFELPGDAGPSGEASGRGQAGEGVRRADAADVIAAWQGGYDVVGLVGGGFAPLPVEWLARHGHRVADLLAARGEHGGRLPAYAVPDAAALCRALDHPPPPSFERLRPLFEGARPGDETDEDGGDGADADVIAAWDAPLPDDLTATLRPYQRRGMSWLALLRGAGLGGVLADDMGLGKTLQALCAASGRTLVVCPTSVVPGWADQARRFRPGLRVSIYHGPGRALDPDADLTLTTYALLRMDIDRLAQVTWDAVFLDEAQAIKNPDSQVARAAYRLEAGFRLTLTGTPVENRLDELWSQLHFANPGLLGGRAAFRDRYEAPIARGEAGAAEALRARVRPFLLRRLKREVAPELPPRTDAVLHVELSDAERAVYDAVRAATQADIAARLAPAAGAGTSSGAGGRDVLAALEEAAADGHKALVFSQWTSLLDLIEPHLRAAGIAWTRLDGATRDRAGVVDAFQSSAGPPVLLISLKAGGTGLNLTAADHVFLCDPWWNPAVEDQAADRAHRIGQDRPVVVYRLVSVDTVEERILALQERKRALADVAVGGADQAGGITREDLLALLE